MSIVLSSQGTFDQGPRMIGYEMRVKFSTRQWLCWYNVAKRLECRLLV